MKCKIVRSISAVFVLGLLAAGAFAGEYVEGEALVVFRAPEGVSVTAAGLRACDEVHSSIVSAANSAGASVADVYEAVSEADGKIFALVRSKTSTTEELIADLKRNPDVIAASPNRIHRHSFRSVRQAARITPNDERFSELWGMSRIRAPEAWPDTTGSDSVFVAVMDSGIYPHEDLSANIDAESGFGNWRNDYNGHGTHIAGTIGAAGNNGIGVAGVNWKVKIIPVKVVPDDDPYIYLNSRIVEGLNYLTGLLQANPEMKLAAVNMSFGGYYDVSPEEILNDTYYLAFRAFDRLNRTLIVAAAGNEGLETGRPVPFDQPDLIMDFNGTNEPEFMRGDYNYPADFTGLNNLIVVSSTEDTNQASSFTNWGNRVDIAAPGSDILSTYSPLAEDENISSGTLYARFWGTSMAAPHVSGAAALLLARYPNATPAQLKNALLEGTNRNINPYAYPYTKLLEEFTDRINEMYEEGLVTYEQSTAVINALPDELGPYRSFDGAGRISRTGLLDVRASMNILGGVNPSSSGSSGGGCSVSSWGLAIVLVCGLWPCRMYSSSVRGR